MIQALGVPSMYNYGPHDAGPVGAPLCITMGLTVQVTLRCRPYWCPQYVSIWVPRRRCMYQYELHNAGAVSVPRLYQHGPHSAGAVSVPVCVSMGPLMQAGVVVVPSTYGPHGPGVVSVPATYGPHGAGVVRVRMGPTVQVLSVSPLRMGPTVQVFLCAGSRSCYVRRI